MSKSQRIRYVIISVFALQPILTFADEPMQMSDLQGFDTSQDDVLNGLDEQFGAEPDGFCINSETSPNGYHYSDGTTICQYYGWWCNKTSGTISYQQAGVTTGASVVIGSSEAVNNTDADVTQDVTVSGTQTSETSYSSSITTGLTWNESFTLKGKFTSGISYDVTTTVGESNSQSSSWEVSDSITVTVPPQSSVVVNMVGAMQNDTVNYSMPIELADDCSFGANFPNQVNGHYFWATSGASLLNQTSGTVTGQIQNATQVDIQLQVEKAQPL